VELAGSSRLQLHLGNIIITTKCDPYAESLKYKCLIILQQGGQRHRILF
jgi:hypothetical protein